MFESNNMRLLCCKVIRTLPKLDKKRNYIFSKRKKKGKKNYDHKCTGNIYIEITKPLLNCTIK